MVTVFCIAYIFVQFYVKFIYWLTCGTEGAIMCAHIKRCVRVQWQIIHVGYEHDEEEGP